MFHFHKWSKWEDGYVEMTDLWTGRNFRQHFQRRTCKVCGKAKTRTITYS